MLFSLFEKKVLDCPYCKHQFKEKNSFYICPQCGKYLKMPPRERIRQVVDKDSFQELSGELKSVDFLNFPGYSEKLEKAQEDTGEADAVVCGGAVIGGSPCAVFVMDSRFIMASMGSVVGEKITRVFEYATRHRLPVIGFTASGGARMQEGIISLMQMAKVSAAVQKHASEGNLYISVLTNPTTGGVTASFAMQGDIILAEPGATVGFAGRRVVEQTTRAQLPDNFQSSEFLQEHGFVDKIVSRDELKASLGTILRLHNGVRRQA
ncbi:MAG: acetyl-CoA carboxylase, carboxyltransferase subunit beta [Firmicutes bacterium]|nr:acetyl-CoA carboxylase, carboxyltransferase subunit beta [Bacillota bacterium]